MGDVASYMNKVKLPLPDFAQLFDLLPGNIIVVNHELTVVAVNKAFTLSDRDHHAPVGKHVTELFHTDPNIIKLSCDHVFTNNEPHSIVFNDAKNRAIRIEFSPVPGTDLVVQFIILKIDYFVHRSIHDMNVSAGRHDQLVQSEQLFADLFDLNPAALAISRLSDSKVVRVNESLLRLLDFAHADEVVGKSGAELKLMNDPQQRSRVVELLKQGKKVINEEGEIFTSKGQHKWISVSIIVVNMKEPCLMTVMLDITDRKKAEEDLKNNNAQLEEQVKQRTEKLNFAELEYHSIMTHATDAIFISDANGKYLDVSPSACVMLGYTREELLNMTTNDILEPNDVKINPPRFSHMKGGRTLLSVRNLVRKDGSLVPVEINGRMMTNGKMLGMVRDITERKKQEETISRMNTVLEEQVSLRTKELEEKIQKLRETEEKFHKAFNASSAGITLTRLSDSSYVEVNDAFLKMIGYTREEVINHTSSDLGLVVDIKKREEVLREMREHGSVRHTEMTVKKRTGEELEVLASIETIVDNGEKLAINIIYDITELKNAQRKLEDVNKELESFSYSVSHDLRAPLRAMIGYANVIEEDYGSELNPEITRNLAIIRNNATRLGHLIDDLLEFSKVGKQELTGAWIDTSVLVERIVAELNSDKECKAQFVIHDLLPAYGDFSMLNQVWYNLISNAIKYSSKKEAPLIELGSYYRDTDIVFYVKDNGAGFNMDFVHKLFGVFQRLHGYADFEGTGVGLALVKRIIDKHEGSVWAEGELDKGATFFFSLPKQE